MADTDTIYLKGRVRGNFKSLFPKHTGDYEIKLIKPTSVSIYNTEEVEPFDFDELKVGRFYEPLKPIENARVYISENQYITQTISSILFLEMKMGDQITIEGELYTKFEAICNFTLSKLAPKFINPVVENKILQKIPRSLFNLIGLGANYDKWTFSEQTVETNSNLAKKKIPSLFWDLFKMIIVAIIVILILWKTPFFILGTFFVIFLVLPLIIRRLYLSFASFQVGGFFLNTLAWICLLAGGFSLLRGHPSLMNLFLLAIGVGLLLASRFGKFLKKLGWILFFASIIGFYVLNKFNKSIEKEDEKSFVENDTKDWDYKPEIEKTKEIKEGEKDTLDVKYLSHYISWYTNFKKGFQTHLKVREDYYHLAKLNHENLNIGESEFREYYNRVYVEMIAQNQDKLDKVIEAYAYKGKKNNLSRTQFADMVVTSIQSIPYCMVHDYSHEKAEKVYGASIANYHETGGPCLANVKFGLQAPAEFIATFKGDCDTRSLLLYYILSKFGYDCVVLGSTQYSHAILGISGPYNGDYITYKGMKYYGWETTAKFFTPGNLSPECNNMRYWQVVLGKMN